MTGVARGIIRQGKQQSTQAALLLCSPNVLVAGVASTNVLVAGVAVALVHVASVAIAAVLVAGVALAHIGAASVALTLVVGASVARACISQNQPINSFSPAHGTATGQMGAQE